MDELDQRLANAVENTLVLRPPRQALATFGTTSIRYYLVAEPSYRDLTGPSAQDESVVREGTVRAERPQVVTPRYLLNHEGFGEEAARYLEQLVQGFGADAPGLLYSYKNEGMETSIVSGAVREVAARIVQRLDREQRSLEAVISGPDDLWDVSLMKFIYELTNSSVRSNVRELRAQGLLHMEGGVPRDALQRIEHLLVEARRGNVEPSEVHRELERWGLFDEYQDQFLSLFKGR